MNFQTPGMVTVNLGADLPWLPRKEHLKAAMAVALPYKRRACVWRLAQGSVAVVRYSTEGGAEIEDRQAYTFGSFRIVVPGHDIAVDWKSDNALVQDGCIQPLKHPIGQGRGPKCIRNEMVVGCAEFDCSELSGG